MMIRAVARGRPAVAKMCRSFSAAPEVEDDTALMQQLKEEVIARRFSVMPPHASDDENPSLNLQPIEHPKECAIVNGVSEWSKGRRAIIYVPARNQMQSGRANTHHWEIRFGARKTWQNPLMGWTSGADAMADLVLKFDTKESALSYAERQGWEADVYEPAEAEDFEGQIAYSHNFLPLAVENELKRYGKNAAPRFKHPTGGHSHWVKTLKYHGNGEVAQHGGEAKD